MIKPGIIHVSIRLMPALGIQTKKLIWCFERFQSFHQNISRMIRRSHAQHTYRTSLLLIVIIVNVIIAIATVLEDLE